MARVNDTITENNFATEFTIAFSVFLAAFAAPIIGFYMVVDGMFFTRSFPMVLIGVGLFALNLAVRRHYR